MTNCIVLKLNVDDEGGIIKYIFIFVSCLTAVKLYVMQYVSIFSQNNQSRSLDSSFLGAHLIDAVILLGFLSKF